MVIDNIFKPDDPAGKGIISSTAFENVLKKQFDVKNLDVQLLKAKYIEKGDNVNYRSFL